MLKVENLSFAFGNHVLFQNVGFSLEAGNLLHLSGDNGVGKSTLIKILAGFLPSTKGNIVFSGVGESGIEYLSAEKNGHMMKLDGLSNLRFWLNLQNHEMSEADLVKTLLDWGIGKIAIAMHLPVEKYSTGMRRRLALARISLSPYKLWFLDEPLFGLDEGAVKKFTELLATHCANGGACLLVSHEKTFLKELDHTVLKLPRITAAFQFH